MIDTSTDNGAPHTPVNRARARTAKRDHPRDESAARPMTAAETRERVARELLLSIAEQGIGDTATATSQAGNEGRDARGRFARGNRGGPGNPFARRVAQFRRTLCESVTDEDIEAVSKKLLDQAKQGDVAAARLLLSYTIGRPAPAVDPDTLDLNEWDIYRRTPANPQDVDNFIGGMPAAFACKLASTMQPYLYAQAAYTHATSLQMDDATFTALQDRAEASSQGCEVPDEAPAAPSTKASNGERPSAPPRPTKRERTVQAAGTAAPSCHRSSEENTPASTEAEHREQPGAEAAASTRDAGTAGVIRSAMSAHPADRRAALEPAPSTVGANRDDGPTAQT
jgi:hypothetical protein